MNKECPFCKPGIFNGRQFYEDDYCIATLTDPDVYGYTLVVLKNHRRDITDPEIKTNEMLNLMNCLNKISGRLKERLGAKRIYVASLCDGVEHLHFHLIPRYEWTEENKKRYRELFIDRDGKESVNRCVSANTIGGFWYLADAERFPSGIDKQKYYKTMMDVLK